MKVLKKLNKKIKIKLRGFMRPLIRWLLYFRYETYYEMGDGALHLGEKVGLANTLFNLSSGDIKVGSYTIFGQNVIVNTGIHQFQNGKRAGLEAVKLGGSWGGGSKEVPSSGRDVVIGEGCWVGSGAIILGPVTIGDHSIIAAGSVLNKNVPSGSFFGGVPAKYICTTEELFQ